MMSNLASFISTGQIQWDIRLLFFSSMWCAAAIAGWLDVWLTLLISVFLVEVAISKDIKDILRSIKHNNYDQTEKSRPNFVDQLSDFIEVHSFAKQLSETPIKLIETKHKI